MSLPDVTYGPGHLIPAYAGRTKESGATTGGATTGINGLAVDRHAQPGRKTFRQVSLYNQIVWTPTSGTTTGAKTATVNAKIQDRLTTAGAGSTWANFGTTGITKVMSATTAAGQAVQTASLNVHRSLEGARRFIRAVVTRVFSTTATGQTLEVFGSFLFHDAEAAPATSTGR